jgi:hypothetical protein
MWLVSNTPRTFLHRQAFLTWTSFATEQPVFCNREFYYFNWRIRYFVSFKFLSPASSGCTSLWPPMLAVLARNGNRQHGHVRVVGGGRNAVIILHLLPRAHYQGLSKMGREGNLLLFKVPHLPLCQAMVLHRAPSATQKASRSQALIRAERGQMRSGPLHLQLC